MTVVTFFICCVFCLATPLSTTKFVLEKRQNKKQVGENLFLPRRGPFCSWSANRESKLLTSGRSRGGVACEGQTFLPRSSPLRDVSRGGNGPSAAMSEEKRQPFAGQGGGGGILSIMVYTGRLALRPKGVHLSGFRYMKGWRFYSLKYLKREGNRSFWSVKGPKRTNG